jgi:hypothetical protein
MGDGSSHNPNPLQKKLYESWCWVKDSLSTNPDILVLNGEPTDGSNPKQLGDQSWSTNLDEQINDALELLKMYKPKHFLMTRGSDYHSKAGTYSVEEDLARRIGAKHYAGLVQQESLQDWDSNRNRTNRTDYYLTFSVNGKVFSVTHHIGFNRWFAYRTTALAREMADMEFLRGRYWKPEDMPSVIVRSHVHYFVYVRFATQHGFTTPAWKLPDSHLFRGGLGGTAPSLGAVEVIVEPSGKVIVEPHIVSNNEYPKHSIIEF